MKEDLAPSVGCFGLAVEESREEEGGLASLVRGERLAADRTVRTALVGVLSASGGVGTRGVDFFGVTAAEEEEIAAVLEDGKA